jgi:outer membrane protein assembly factor BamB
VAGSGVFVGSGTQFYAVNRRDGTSLWTRDLGLPTYQYSPAVADDTVFAVARDLASAWRGGDEAGVLMAIGAESGAIRWQRDALVNSSPIVRGDLLYHAATSSDRGFLRARSTSGGAERWSYEFGSDDEPSRSFGVPAIADDVVFATGSVGPERDTTGHLVALDPATGEELWTETFSAAVELTPVYSDGSVFVASEDGRLSSIDAETRSTVWARQFEKPLLSKPSVGNGLVYCLSKERVTAVDRASGETVWRRTVAPVQSTITVTSTAVYVGGDDMDVFDAATGEPRWQREIDGYSGAFGVPVVVNGYVYVGACVKPTGEAAYDNYVYVLG